ncbi:long-chain-fatty-acid--CoA ligase ACSBG1 isoform X3 [Manis pentadactyla]|uniref:long-chain-fatty-acid--CoA ligase ACSBG1 isoform X3 n=1 Tax=Manis pentadactyla TaxID=143292 RepID=UPI00255CDC6F|nr:long-chain-fatty-acid--CoA ligase ACSBG1 isoform X3 [Manis pentadactyla]
MLEALLLRSASSILRTVLLSRLPPFGPGCVRKLSLNLPCQQGVRPDVRSSSLTAGQALPKGRLSHALEPSSAEKAKDGQADSPEEALWTTRADGRVRLRIDPSCPDPPHTVHRMFCETLDKYGDLSALGFKRQGSWEHISYSQYYQLSRKAAKGFLKLGLERTHSVAILGFNSPEWFFSAVGTVFAGGTVTGIYTTSSPEACQYIAHDSHADIIVVDTQEQLGKILKIWKNLPHLKAVVVYREPPAEKMANVYMMEQLLGLGSLVPEEALDAVIAAQQPNQRCVLIYTSGTTGPPKGVMLSQDNITWTARYGSQAGGIQHAEVQQEVVVSYLPLSHIAAQIYDLWTGIQWGAHVCFAEPNALKGSLVSTLREVEPTSHLGVPRVWEKIMEGIQEVVAQSGFIRRKMLLWAMSVTLQHNLTSPGRWASTTAMWQVGPSSQTRELEQGSQCVAQPDPFIQACASFCGLLSSPTSDLKPFTARLADFLVLAKVRQALGLARCQKHFYGAAPMSMETQHFFLGLNIRLYAGYGLSETSGPHFMSSPCNYRLCSSGKVMPGCRAKLADPDAGGVGEICLWGRNIFMGYLNMEAETREAIDDQGWLRTGDTGRLDAEGFLYVTGRIKELIITAGGENVPPVPLEEAVKRELPIISNAMLLGDQRKFLAMLLTLKCTVDPDTSDPTDNLTEQAVEFCQSVGSTATKVSEVVGKDEAVYRAIEEGIRRVNRNAAARPYHIQKWAILGKDFSIPGGELGPTMKLKRFTVLEKYKDTIDSFYQEQK